MLLWCYCYSYGNHGLLEQQLDCIGNINRKIKIFRKKNTFNLRLRLRYKFNMNTPDFSSMIMIFCTIKFSLWSMQNDIHARIFLVLGCYWVDPSMLYGRKLLVSHPTLNPLMGFLNACSRKCILLGEAYILIHTYNLHSGRLSQFCPHLFNSGGLLGLLNRFGPWKLEVKWNWKFLQVQFFVCVPIKPM